VAAVKPAVVSIVTAGHLSTCPRMLKAADALAAAGYRVRMVSVQHTEWATAADDDVRRARRDAWPWTVVSYDRRRARPAYLRSGVRTRATQALVAAVGPGRSALSLAARAHSRAHPELIRATLAVDADLIYGGTTGALAAVAEAGRRSGTPYALDLEDFHSAERDDGPAGRRANALAERIERAVLPGAAFLTAASPAIAAAYADKYGVHPIPIHNVFPLPARAPDLAPSPGDGLRLYWFSQTIGPGRGLEDAVRAMGLGEIPGALHLRGRAVPGYLERLIRLAQEAAPRLEIVHHAPAPPDAMVELCAGYDVGLTLEQALVLNRALCLNNKALTYILAGLAVAISDTSGQRPLGRALGEAAVLYRPGDVPALAAGLKRWAADKALLARAKALAWEAAGRRWHWEHPEERGALLRAVAAALDR